MEKIEFITTKFIELSSTITRHIVVSIDEIDVIFTQTHTCQMMFQTCE